MEGWRWPKASEPISVEDGRSCSGAAGAAGAAGEKKAFQLRGDSSTIRAANRMRMVITNKSLNNVLIIRGFRKMFRGRT